MPAYFDRFADDIRAARQDQITQDVTLGGRLILDRAGDLTINYAPFEHIQRSARVVIVGITPGASQAVNALCELRRALLGARDKETALAAAKVFASFSGAMRVNLVAMLNHIGLAKWLGLASTELLWTTHSHLAHFTSALRYPVFVAGENYNGQPSMKRSPPLLKLIDTCLAEEAEALPGAVWVPLGPKAAAGVERLVKTGVLDVSRVLTGMYHPSGLNGERISYFLGKIAREDLSIKTNPVLADAARARIMQLVSRLPAANSAAP